MRAANAILLGCLLIGCLPGFVEIGEDVLHVVREGHTLHTGDHQGEGERPTHGCDDCTHCVSCHGQGSPFVAAVIAHVPETAAMAIPNVRSHEAGVALDGVRFRLERPPQS